MTIHHVETLIIGAGQAGLATGRELKERGREFLVVDAGARVGDNWRSHWDSLTLYSPAKYDGLPGLPFPGDPWAFPGKEAVADYLEQYAATMKLPIRLRTSVERLEARSGGFTAHLGSDTIECANVVIATGPRTRTPRVPDFADELDPQIRQMHSTGYRNAAQLAPGPTLIVGASHTGCDLAYEVATDRPTFLVGPDRGQIPLHWDSPLIKLALPVIVFLWLHVLTRRTPMGRKEMRGVRSHGAPMLRVKRHHLAERGVERIEDKVTGVSPEGKPMLEDGRTLDVANVIWCTGYQPRYDWMDLPICDEQGWPREYRGVVEDVPGLFFCGLAFQYAFGSMVLPGVGRDAAYVAKKIDARARTQVPAAA